MVKVFHKPYRVLSQFRAVEGKRSLSDFPQLRHQGKAVGRLDEDSEGLLLVTNEVALQQALTRPGQVEKVYRVQVEGVPEAGQLLRLAEGVCLKDGWTRPARVRALEQFEAWPRDPPIRFRQRIPTRWIEIVLQEGRNRQVRRMTAAVGLPTLRLIRVAIGPIQLGNLEIGASRSCNPEESRWLKSLLSVEEARPKRRTRL